MKPKSIKLFWTLGLLAVLLLASAVATVRLAPRLFPSQYVSDIYRAYADQPGIEATFLHNFPVNDTLSLDVTTLKAVTDSAWGKIMRDFNITPYPPEILKLIDSNSIQIRFVLKGTLSTPQDSIPTNNDIQAFSQFKKYISIFNVETDAQIDAIFRQKTHETTSKNNMQ